MVGVNVLKGRRLALSALRAEVRNVRRERGVVHWLREVVRVEWSSMIRRREGCGLCFALLNFAVGFTQITPLGKLTEELVIVSSQVLL
jgi:hypothetical protein